MKMIWHKNVLTLIEREKCLRIYPTGNYAFFYTTGVPPNSNEREISNPNKIMKAFFNVVSELAEDQNET